MMLILAINTAYIALGGGADKAAMSSTDEGFGKN